MSAGLMSAILIGALTVFVVTLVFWVITARRVNRERRAAQVDALARLGRTPTGAPIHRGREGWNP